MDQNVDPATQVPTVRLAPYFEIALPHKAKEDFVLERISDLPDPVVGIKASGEVTGEDYKNVLIPAIDEAIKRGQKVRLLYVLGDDVKGLGFTAGAAWQDTKVGLGHYSSWEKVAVISDKDWLRHSVDIFGYLIPGEVKAFASDKEAEARTWVSS